MERGTAKGRGSLTRDGWNGRTRDLTGLGRAGLLPLRRVQLHFDTLAKMFYVLSFVFGFFYSHCLTASGGMGSNQGSRTLRVIWESGRVLGVRPDTGVGGGVGLRRGLG